MALAMAVLARNYGSAPHPADDRPLPAQGEWTYEDYRRLPDDGWRYEVVKGVLFMSPAPSPRHQAILRNFAYLLGLHLRTNPAGRLYFAPIDVLLPGGLGAPVQPDLIFIPQERLEIVKDQLIDGAPDLVLEVYSPSNWLDDRKTKYEAYAQAGVREYWLADPKLRTIEVFVLREGVYELLGRFGPGEQARSAIPPGFEPALDDVFAA